MKLIAGCLLFTLPSYYWAAGDCLQKGALEYGCEPHRQRLHEICCKVPQQWAERSGFQDSVNFFGQLEAKYGVPSEVVFYDSQCGIPLYVAPRGRTYAEWKQESISHGWPSFREKEVVHENVKMEPGYNGELVSKCNTHLGHNLPDYKGRRDCVNLMCMAGTFVNVSSSANVKTTASTKSNGTSSGSAAVDIKAGTAANRTSNTSGTVKRVTVAMTTGGSGQLPPAKQHTGGSGKMPPPAKQSKTVGSPAGSSTSLSITGCTSGFWVLLLSVANLWQWKAQAQA